MSGNRINHLTFQDYEEVLSLASKGSDKPLYQYMGDLRNGTKEKDAYSLFPDQMLIYAMGKAVGKEIGEIIAVAK